MSAPDGARTALRARQGAGARYDATAAPHDELLLARRGTAYFARLLNGLSDAALARPSRRAGWTRAHVVAHLGYHARAMALLVEGVRAGRPARLFQSGASLDDIDLGATLPRRALRHLFDHAEVHLNVEWRDLTDAEWDSAAQDMAGDPLPLRATPMLHAVELWGGALDLDAGGRAADLPVQVRSIAGRARS